jgi:hypothetical protein
MTGREVFTFAAGARAAPGRPPRSALAARRAPPTQARRPGAKVRIFLRLVPARQSGFSEWPDQCQCCPVKLSSTFDRSGDPRSTVHAILGPSARPRWRHGFPRSHGPSEERVDAAKANLRLLAGSESPDVRVSSARLGRRRAARWYPAPILAPGPEWRGSGARAGEGFAGPVQRSGTSGRRRSPLALRDRARPRRPVSEVNRFGPVGREAARQPDLISAVHRAQPERCSTNQSRAAAEALAKSAT